MYVHNDKWTLKLSLQCVIGKMTGRYGIEAEWRSRSGFVCNLTIVPNVRVQFKTQIGTSQTVNEWPGGFSAIQFNYHLSSFEDYHCFSANDRAE